LPNKIDSFDDSLIESWKIISNELASLRDAGISDEEIYKFGLSIINHYNPKELEKIKNLSDKQDALWREANDL